MTDPTTPSPDEIFYTRMRELGTPKKGEFRDLFIQLYDDCERLLASAAGLNTDEYKENKKLFADAVKKYKEIRGRPDGEPCEPLATLSDALSLDGAAGSSQRRRDCSEGHLQVRNGVCEACGKSWLDSLREEVREAKPEVPLSDTLDMYRKIWNRYRKILIDDFPEIVAAVERLHADHARLIEAVEKKEGVKAFADLHFPPAA